MDQKSQENRNRGSRRKRTKAERLKQRIFGGNEIFEDELEFVKERPFGMRRTVAWKRGEVRQDGGVFSKQKRFFHKNAKRILEVRKVFDQREHAKNGAVENGVKEDLLRLRMGV